VAIVVFGVGQLVLPGLAAHVVRGRVDKYGRVLSVSVSATPAIELAFGDADTVTVHMANYRAPTTTVAKNLGQASAVTNLKVSVDTVTSGLFTATHVQLTKHSRRLVGTGLISEASLRAAIPGLESVKLVSSQGGVLTLRGTENTGIFGTITADFTVAPEDGKVAVAATGLLRSLIDFTVWSDPKVRVTSISGTSTPTGLNVTATAQMN
jgi:hypothetical protein